MVNILLFVISIIWLIGACLRVYRHARYYQIEEYMSLRYLRWLFAVRRRWLPTRPLIAFGIGAVFSFMFSESPDGILPAIIGTVSAAAAAYPPAEGEVKKAFRATARAKRLLSAAFVIAAVLMLVGLWLVSRVSLEGSPEIQVIAVSALGFAVFLAAPFTLIASNLIMTPVEAWFRRGFIQRARRVLDEVHPDVIGITGSYGKTSTKSYLAHILNGRYKAYATPKSFNTLMGICLATNNNLANDHSIDYFLVEMGAYIPGEIARICDLTHPRIGVVVEVGPQHLERFGSLENVVTAKYELIKALPPDGVGVFNWDNPHVREMYERGYPNNRIAVSREIDLNSPEAPRFVATDIQESLDGLRFTIHDRQTGENAEFTTSLLGLHNVTNLLLATAVAVHEGMPLREVTRRVRSLQPAESRLERRTSQGITIINDAYSANPVGAEQALRVLGMHTTGKRLLITPGMVELGALMESENRKLGEVAAKYATDVILVGSQTAPIKEGLIRAGFPEEQTLTVDTLGEAVDWYQRNLKAGDTVLFLNDLPDTYSS
ncbi:MAG TPA: UDP-N-acetylmuramoyl-tripeptide--D-alanyl-D-alanine ligase [Oceanobacillus sp.]|nr:UDP-N-acetylmuramoyl-tripeptide--D-alanyl-D-alanine ligase [Oceanobacillus sp.]